MNRKKSATSLGFPSLVLLAIAMAIVSASGIGYVVMKNRQLTIRREITALRDTIEDHNRAIAQQNFYSVTTVGLEKGPGNLARQGSQLIDIPSERIERYHEPSEEIPEEGRYAQN